ncbi:hypothetical protein [Saccharicrinis sp. 156]|uniref:hypothetical protein n=1 Tax=Saccharicrinis sp. 156 TaxID=3417574 RepID=UPI003D3370C9
MRLLSFCIAFILGMGIASYGQYTDVLNTSNNRKIARADKKIKKGDAVVGKKEKYTRQIEEIETEGKSRKGKIRRLETKANKIVMGSASYYKEGYGKKYSVYKKSISKGIKQGSLNSDVESLVEVAKDDYKEGRKLRRKSANHYDLNKAASMLMEANEKENKAIAVLAKATGNIEEITKKEDTMSAEIQDSALVVPDTEMAIIETLANVVQDSLKVDSISVSEIAMSDTAMIADAISVQDSALIVNADTVAVTPITAALISPVLEAEVNNEPLVEEPVKEGIADLYFSVQFLAEKQPVPKDKLQSLYDGPFEVVKHEADGWVRYSFGRFKTLEEANTMKTRSGVQGYVVAYLHEERISTRTAAGMLSN